MMNCSVTIWTKTKDIIQNVQFFLSVFLKRHWNQVVSLKIWAVCVAGFTPLGGSHQNLLHK